MLVHLGDRIGRALEALGQFQARRLPMALILMERASLEANREAGRVDAGEILGYGAGEDRLDLRERRRALELDEATGGDEPVGAGPEHRDQQVRDEADLRGVEVGLKLVGGAGDGPCSELHIISALTKCGADRPVRRSAMSSIRYRW